MSSLDGLYGLRSSVRGMLAADNKEQYIECKIDEDDKQLIIQLLTDRSGSLFLTTGDVASVLRMCFTHEGPEKNVWISGYSSDQNTIIVRTHPDRR